MKETRWSQVKRQVFTCFLGRNTWPTSVLPRTWIWWCSVWFCHTACSLCGLQQYEQCMCIMCHVPGFGPFRCDELGHLSVLQIGCLGIPVLKTQTDSKWFKLIQTATHYWPTMFWTDFIQSVPSVPSVPSVQLSYAELLRGPNPSISPNDLAQAARPSKKAESWKLRAKWI